MVVDWILRSTKNMRVTKQSMNSVLYFQMTNSCNSQQLRGSLWLTPDLHSAQKMLSFDIRFHRVIPKVAIILRIDPFTCDG